MSLKQKLIFGDLALDKKIKVQSEMLIIFKVHHDKNDKAILKNAFREINIFSKTETKLIMKN